MAAPGKADGVGRAIIAVVVAAHVGSLAGFGAATLANPANPKPVPQEREFWVFTVVLPFNDSKPGFPSHDYFAPDRMTVNKGDTVKIHFFNTEDEPEDHTFTMQAPYAMDHDLPYGQTTDITFVAGNPGIFSYRCRFHQPTMTGWLVVLD